MGRDYKNLIQGHYYHIYNRGNHFQDIFRDDQDYFNLLKRISLLLNDDSIPPRSHSKGHLRLKQLPKGSFDIVAYCLMPNHFHFLIRQNSDLPISIFMNRLFSSYVKYFNAKYNTAGSLFQDTYKAKIILDDTYLTYASAYIHNNPSHPLEYPYSSFQEYITGVRQVISGNEIILNQFDSRESYKNWVIDFKTKDIDNHIKSGEGDL